MIRLPPAFIDQMRQLLGEAALQSFLSSLHTPSPTSLRYNSFKAGASISTLKKIPWSENGYYLPERPVFTLDPLFHAGTYYVQEAASMLTGTAIQKIYHEDSRPLKVLDLCAAPGGKSTDLLSVLPEGSLLVANEVIRSRYSILRHNLIKWGRPNIISTNHDSADFARLSGFFDLILVDAPCSGEGLFRKDPKAVEEWSPDAVRLCSKRQRRILGNISKALAPGGHLIYSTCTYNRQENEENAQWLKNDLRLEPLDLKLPTSWNIENRSIGYQFYPHRTQGEGFYLAAFRKDSGSVFKTPRSISSISGISKKDRLSLQQWVSNAHNYHFFQSDERAPISAIPAGLEKEISLLMQVLQRSKAGLELGNFKGKNFVPQHDLALSTFVNKKQLPSVELSLPEALKYLKKEQFEADQMPEGWMMVEYQGHTLGWAKGLKSRVNNYFPKNWRIRMKI